MMTHIGGDRTARRSDGPMRWSRAGCQIRSAESASLSRWGRPFRASGLAASTKLAVSFTASKAKTWWSSPAATSTAVPGCGPRDAAPPPHGPFWC